MLGDVVVDPSDHRVRELIAGRERLLDPAREVSRTVANSFESADDDGAARREPARVAVVAAVVARDGRIARKPRSRAGERVDGVVEDSGRLNPVDPVVTSVPARKPGAAARGEVDGTTRAEQLVRDLAPGLPAPDDENRSLGELARPAVLARRQLELDRRGVDPGHSRSRLLERPAGHDDVRC